ncbi:MAG: formamidopyrimidine-DNA glycosylase [Planctomycetota bacterium]|nr:formamidopyrimidine-DNA glycosylase [Planctomycetota bacterium]
MPELPDVTVYIGCMERKLLGTRLERIRLASPFLVRSVEPPIQAAEGREVIGFRRLGKRIAIGFEGELHLVFHLMIAGRFRWREKGADIPKRRGLAAFDFTPGCLLLTEAGTKKRASLHAVQGEEALREHDPGGIDVLKAGLETFRERLLSENHTLKRSLCAPRLFSGIGNAYSDEILHRARLSPIKLTSRLADEEVERLHRATRETLLDWIERLTAEVGDGFPEKVTAFRAGMAVHGRFREPCPECGSPVQRIVHAESETNYCAECQTGGKILADRALSKLLKTSWPRTLEELG